MVILLHVCDGVLQKRYSLFARDTFSIGSWVVTVHSSVHHNGQQQLCVLE